MVFVFEQVLAALEAAPLCFSDPLTLKNRTETEALHLFFFSFVCLVFF